MVTRRAFLAALGAAGAGMVYDPEFALWKPGARTFFLPSPEPEVSVGQILFGQIVSEQEHDVLQVIRVTRDYLTGIATADLRWWQGQSRPIIAHDVRVPWATPSGPSSGLRGNPIEYRRLRHPELLRFRS